MPGWNDTLTILNTLDTALGIVIFTLALNKARKILVAWWKRRGRDE